MNRLFAQTVNFGGTNIQGPLDPDIKNLGDLIDLGRIRLHDVSGKSRKSKVRPG